MNMSYSDDIETVRENVKKYQAGDEGAFEWLMERYESGLNDFVYKMVKDNYLKENIIQDVWLRVWEYRDTYKKIFPNSLHGYTG